MSVKVITHQMRVAEGSMTYSCPGFSLTLFSAEQLFCCKESIDWFKWFSEAAFRIHDYITLLAFFGTGCHITSPQIMLLLLLLISSKSVASNNKSQCFGVICQGFVAPSYGYKLKLIFVLTSVWSSLVLSVWPTHLLLEVNVVERTPKYVVIYVQRSLL